MAHTILVVEDDRKIARVVKVYLEHERFRVVTVENGKDAVDFISQEIPALVILDLMLPDMTGEEVCQELRDTGDFPIIMLTAKSSEEERVAGFSLGADDYVVKPFSPRELVARVKAVMKRAQKKDSGFSGPMSFNGGQLVIDTRDYEVTRGGLPLTLTPTEFKIIAVLAGFPGRVFTRGELVENALGYQFEGYERSIDAHIKNIRQKIEDDPRNPVFIHTVYGVGYKFSGKTDVQKPLG